MDKELVAHIVEFVKMEVRDRAGAGAASSPAGLLQWEQLVHESVTQLRREAVQQLATEAGTGYQGSRVKRGKEVLRFKGNRPETVHGRYRPITVLGAHYVSGSGETWVPLAEALRIECEQTPACENHPAQCAGQAPDQRSGPLPGADSGTAGAGSGSDHLDQILSDLGRELGRLSQCPPAEQDFERFEGELHMGLTNGPASVWKEPVPYGVLDANAVLHPAPEPFSPQELVEAALPGAWKEGKTNGIALAQALSRSRGTALPWGLVRDAIAASAASRWLRLATGSSLVNCRYEEAGSLVLERPVDESQRYTVTPATRGAVLDGAQIQDLADQIPQLLAASAGADLRFRVQVDLAGELSRENRAVLDELLVEISEDLRPDS